MPLRLRAAVQALLPDQPLLSASAGITGVSVGVREAPTEPGALRAFLRRRHQRLRRLAYFHRLTRLQDAAADAVARGDNDGLRQRRKST